MKARRLPRSMYIFGGGSDIVVPAPYYKFDTKGLSRDAVSRVIEYNPLMLATHSQALIQTRSDCQYSFVSISIMVNLPCHPAPVSIAHTLQNF